MTKIPRNEFGKATRAGEIGGRGEDKRAPKRKRRDAPFSLRLTFEERAALEDAAGAMPLSAYMKSLLFAEDAPKHRKKRRAAEADEKLLAELLACLGSSRLAEHVKRLADAAESGTVFDDAETKADIRKACDDVHAMRVMLMRALGMQVEDADSGKESLSQTFERAAAKEPVLVFRHREYKP